MEVGLKAARDVAYDPEARRLYVIDGYAGAVKLIRIDPAEGEVMPIGAIGTVCAGLAFHPVERALYCSGKDLLRLDPQTGAGVSIGPLGFEAVNGLAFHPATRVLYGVDEARHALLSIDVASGQSTVIERLKPQVNQTSPPKPPPYLQALLERMSASPATLSAQQIAGIEGAPPQLPARGLAFGPDRATLFTSTTRLTAIDPATAVARNRGFEGYWNERGRRYLDYILPMRRIQKERGITYMASFVQKPNAPVGDFVYILDVNTDENHSFLGDEDKLPEADAEAIFEQTKLGKTYVSDVQLWDLWDLLKTAYAPIFNQEGEVSAVIGTDINVNVIEHKTRIALLKTALLGAVAMCIAGLVVYLMTERMVQPIQRLQDAALNVAAGTYGLTVEPSGPRELRGLSDAFNAMSLELKTSFDEKIEANRLLQARVSRRELALTLSREADVMGSFQTPVFCCRCLGEEGALEDVSGWVTSESLLLLWFGLGASPVLEASRRRREISLVATSILQRYDQDWDRLAERLKMLFTDSVASFVFMDADHGRIRTLTREPLPVLLMGEFGIRQETLTDKHGVSLAVNQACVVGPAASTPVMQRGAERYTDDLLVAEDIVSSIELAYAESEQDGTSGVPSQTVVGVMSRSPWWQRQADDMMTDSG